MPAEWFNDWKRYHDEDQWGESREDLRRMAYALLQEPDSDVSPVYPYFENADDDDERGAELIKRSKSLDPAEVAEKFRKAREAHLKAKRV